MRVVASMVGILLMFSLGQAWGATTCPAATKLPAAGACAKGAHAKAKVAAAATAAVPDASNDAASWKAILDPLSTGGWAYISDGPLENPSAVYASTHNVLHNGNVVTAWMRWEFSRPQAEVYPLHYLSAVTREELDCDARAYRRSAVIYYERNNLREKGPSFTALNDDTTWKPAIPGSEPDAMLNWGCAPPPAHTAPAAKATPAPKAAAVAASSSAPAAAAPGTDLHTVR